MTSFKTGNAYSTRFACDWDSILTRVVIKRTAKMVWLDDLHGNVRKCGITIRDGVETCKPTGTYSMCPILSADKGEILR